MDEDQLRVEGGTVSGTFFTTLEQNVVRRLACRSPLWPGPGNTSTESPPLTVPSGHIPYEFVETVSQWVDDFNGRCIADGQSPGARITMSVDDLDVCKLKAES